MGVPILSTNCKSVENNLDAVKSVDSKATSACDECTNITRQALLNDSFKRFRGTFLPPFENGGSLRVSGIKTTAHDVSRVP